MRNRQPWPPLVVVFILLASGCLGKGKGSANDEPVATDPDTLPEGVTNVLEGTVQSSDLSPLSSANITINGLEAFNLTDASGHYRFESLPPRDYIVVANKEGYRPKSQRAIIEDERIFQLDFLLEEIPTTSPYNITTPFTGFIACQAAYQTSPDNTQRPNCGSGLPDNVQAHNFDVGIGAAQVVIEITWQPRTELASILTATVESLGSDAVQYGMDKGPPGLKIVVSQSLLRKTLPEGGPIRVTVESGPSITGDEAAIDVGLAFQQPFTIYFTVFYIEPGPTSFSAIPK